MNKENYTYILDKLKELQLKFKFVSFDIGYNVPESVFYVKTHGPIDMHDQFFLKIETELNMHFIEKFPDEDFFFIDEKLKGGVDSYDLIGYIS